ncbi:MAG: VOC family protein [Alphaproteobacteria bacterium]|nr:VOC family protein [Alphaproteobacteria bacterium]
MDPRISRVTLGVEDMKRSRAFYETLGWKASPQSNDDVTFFQAGGSIFGLYGRAGLADDANVEDTPSGFRGVALSYNARDRADVDAVLAEAVAAGAALVKEAEDAFWGGYSGYFADPDGHLWEVAHNPYWVIGEDGSMVLDPDA